MARFGKKRRTFGANPTLTERENAKGGSSQAEQRLALRGMAPHFPGGLSEAEKKFVKGTATQDPARVKVVIERARKANRKRK